MGRLDYLRTFGRVSSFLSSDPEVYQRRYFQCVKSPSMVICYNSPMKLNGHCVLPTILICSMIQQNKAKLLIDALSWQMRYVHHSKCGLSVSNILVYKVTVPVQPDGALTTMTLDLICTMNFAFHIIGCLDNNIQSMLSPFSHRQIGRPAIQAPIFKVLS